MDPPSAAGAGDGDDLADDFESISFNSTTTTTTTATTAVDAKRSTSSGSSSSAVSKPHAPSSDPCWNAIRNRVRTKSSPRVNGDDGACDSDLALGDLHFVHRLGSGDIGRVYLVELKETDGKKSSSVVDGCLFAAKVMDRKELASRNKETRARVEREILEMLDHPFLPTLYAAIETPMFSCLLTEFCPGGDLHVLRQRRPGKRFDEGAVRFYASEVIVALEYLHLLGIIYRDLKPENVLVRSDGHIMLTDFDLSLKSDGTASISTDPTLDPSSTTSSAGAAAASVAASCYYSSDPQSFSGSSCILPNCIVPAVSCFRPKRRRKKNGASGKYKFSSGGIGSGGGGPPEIIAEPVDVRSMSFVGTHEYLAPEIVSGEGHGSAVDWWTLGIFIFELFYGVTPFKGFDHELTLANIVARALEFPKEPSVPAAAKDLMTQLLVKDPARRMGSTAGSTALKRHPFFAGVNWALLRCAAPPYVPRPVTSADFIRAADNGKDNDNNNDNDNSVEYY